MEQIHNSEVTSGEETEKKNRKRKTCARFLQTVLGGTVGGRRNPHCSSKVCEVFLAPPQLETRLTRKPWTHRHPPPGRSRAVRCVLSDNGATGKVADASCVPAKAPQRSPSESRQKGFFFPCWRCESVYNLKHGRGQCSSS